MRKLRGWALIALATVAFGVDALPSAAAELPTDPKCEFIASPGSSKCMLPFPDDYYTKADPTSPTGRRIDFRRTAMPTNVSACHRSRPLQRRRRLQPRRGDPAQGARDRNGRRRRGDATRCRSTTSAATGDRTRRSS